MRAKHGALLPAITVFVAIGLAIVAIPWIVRPPEYRSAYFWHRIVWTELLWLLASGLAPGLMRAILSRGDTANQSVPIHRADVVVARCYAVLSFAAMMLHAWMPDSSVSTRAHIIVQILLFVALVVMLAALTIHQRAAVAGGEAHPADLPSTHLLAALLRSREDELRQLVGGAYDANARSLLQSLRQLREYMEHGIPTAGAFVNGGAYRAAVGKIDSLCSMLDTLGDIADIAAQADEGAALARTIRQEMQIAVEEVRK